MPVYHQAETIHAYLYQGNLLPAMSELTACLRLNRENSGLPQDEYFISIAIRSQHNEFLVGWNLDSVLDFYIGGKQTLAPLSEGFDMNDFIHGWHTHCFTYKAGGFFKVIDSNYCKLKFLAGL